MGKSVLLSIVTLVAGFVIGAVCNFGFLTPGVTTIQATTIPQPSAAVPGVTPAELVPTATSAGPTASPALDTSDNTVLLAAAAQVVTTLADQDYAALSACVHPVKGVLFTPYSTVEPEVNLTFSKAQIAGAAKDGAKYVWGISDGKGDPIELTMADYFARYVYNVDFANAPQIGVDQVLGSGNALENVQEVYPDARFVEYYFPGVNPEYNGFDWCGLKLVFEPYNNEYRLISLIHSEWTI